MLLVTCFISVSCFSAAIFKVTLCKLRVLFICCFECCYLKIIFFQDYFALSQKVSNFVGVYVK